MLTELYHKGGRLCQPAREGQLRCPLLVRPTSEDVITGHLVGALRVLNPRWILPDLLNEALGSPRFRRQYFRRLRVEPWKNRSHFPRELVPWDEGSTQVDVTITWENPPTTVFLEMKYGSDLSARAAGDDGQSGYPSDQLIRSTRVGLWESGWYPSGRLFPTPARDFVLVLVAPTKGHPLVQQYRDPETLRQAIPHSDQLPAFPRLPFLGELDFRDLVRLLRRQRRWFTRPEKHLVELLSDYLQYKIATRPLETRE